MAVPTPIFGMLFDGDLSEEISSYSILDNGGSSVTFTSLGADQAGVASGSQRLRFTAGGSSLFSSDEDARSFGFWVQIDSFNGRVLYRAPNLEGFFIIRPASGGNWQFQMRGDVGGGTTIVSCTTTGLGISTSPNLHSVVCTWSGGSSGTMKVYVNGTEQASVSSVEPKGYEIIDNMYFFADENNNDDMSGDLAAFYIWDSELSSSEVSDFHNSGTEDAYPFGGGGGPSTPEDNAAFFGAGL